jgi:hypothetical protein
MKYKTKFFLFFAFALISCEKDQKPECECTAKYMTDNGGYFYVPKNPIDCETRQPKKYHPYGWFVGCVD